MRILKLVFTFLTFFTFDKISYAQTAYTMPAETNTHEGTWLQWPHHYTYGLTYQRLEY